MKGAVTVVLCPKALPLLAVDHKSRSNDLSGMFRSAFGVCKAGLWSSCCALLLLDCSLVSDRWKQQADITLQWILNCSQSPAAAALAVPLWLYILSVTGWRNMFSFGSWRESCKVWGCRQKKVLLDIFPFQVKGCSPWMETSVFAVTWCLSWFSVPLILIWLLGPTMT